MTDVLNSSVYIYSYQDGYVELMPTWGYAVSAFVLFLIGFFGFFLNLMVIILMFKDKQLWTPLNLILFNLVCSDFSVSILGNPFTLISALSHRWVFGKTMCVLYGFFMTLLGITSITTLTVLSFERYMMVSRPLVSRHLSMRGASVSVVLIWSYSFLVTTPPLFGWGNYVNEAANISCSVNWEEQTFNTLTYILFLFAFGLVIPVIVITFSYMNIIRTMKKNSFRMGRVTKAESRVTTMVFIMIVMFMVAWTPYSILALIEQFAPRDMVSPGLGVVPALIAKSSICYDPIIYVGMNTQFRVSVKRIFGFKGKDDSQERGVENTLMSPTKAVSQTKDTNIKLQYINPSNNTMVAVRIYEDEDYDPSNNTDSNDDYKKKKKVDKMKKKVTLTERPLQEKSSELYADSFAERINNEQNVFSLNNVNNAYHMDNDTSNISNIISVTYPMCDHNISSTPLINTTKQVKKLTRAGRRSDKFADKVSENSSSGNLNDSFNSDEMLLTSESMSVQKKSGTINMAMNYWDESQTNSSDLIHSGVVNTFFKRDSAALPSGTSDERPVPARRKSLTGTHLRNKTDADTWRIKCNSRRRQSSGVLSGHTRKLSAALNDNKGDIVTRLMVDEREMSKLVCFK